MWRHRQDLASPETNLETVQRSATMSTVGTVSRPAALDWLTRSLEVRFAMGSGAVKVFWDEGVTPDDERLVLHVAWTDGPSEAVMSAAVHRLARTLRDSMVARRLRHGQFVTRRFTSTWTWALALAAHHRLDGTVPDLADSEIWWDWSERVAGGDGCPEPRDADVTLAGLLLAATHGTVDPGQQPEVVMAAMLRDLGPDGLAALVAI